MIVRMESVTVPLDLKGLERTRLYMLQVPQHEWTDIQVADNAGDTSRSHTLHRVRPPT